MVKKYLTKVLAYIKAYFYKKNIQRILLVYLTTVSIIGIILIVIPIYINFTDTVEDMVKEKNIEVINETNRYLDSNLKNIMKISDTIYYQLIKNSDLANESIKDEIKLLASASKEEIVNIALFDEFGKIEEADTDEKLKPGVDPRRDSWFSIAKEDIGEIHFSKPHVQDLFSNSKGYNWVASLSRGVDITKNGRVEKDVLLIDINFTGIEEVCREANSGSDGYVYLISQEGEIIYHPRQQLIYSGIEEENIDLVIRKDDGSYMEDFQNKNQLVTIKTVGYTGWKLVSVTPINEIVSEYARIRIFILISLAIVLLIILYISYFASSKIASPIERLEKSVKKIEGGNIDNEISISGPTEIRNLGITINSMVKEMKKLMDDIIYQQEAKRKSELNALQSQINPHFLYNTLDSIIWMVENNRFEGAVTMVTSLARLFRISLSKGENIITVKQELEHAKHYLTIQNIRYKNKFTYSIYGESQVLELQTLKLVVQPMIENAIYHGMTYMSEDEGEIKVRAYTKEGNLIIDISDNGAGMPLELVESIKNNNKDRNTNKFGIGIKNVQERIRLTFGEEYGLDIISEPDEGTTIRLKMPIIKNTKIKAKDGILIEK